jgi:hypothetical protein
MRIPAVAARCLRQRVAACRSIRRPMVLPRIGPVCRSLTARSMARLTAGGSGMRTTLAPFPAHAEDAVAVFLAEVGNAGAAGFEDP